MLIKMMQDLQSDAKELSKLSTRAPHRPCLCSRVHFLAMQQEGVANTLLRAKNLLNGNQQEKNDESNKPSSNNLVHELRHQCIHSPPKTLSEKRLDLEALESIILPQAQRAHVKFLLTALKLQMAEEVKQLENKEANNFHH